MALVVALLLNATVALGALFVAGSAFAQDFDPPEQSDAKFHALNRFGDSIYSSSAIFWDLDYINDPQTHADCFDLLWATEQRIGRNLTDREIWRLLPTILAALKETAAQNSPGPAEPQSQEGLASHTKVLTAKGPMYIALLRPGGEVLSFDVKTGDLVTNRVVRLYGGISTSLLGIRPPSINDFGPHLSVSRDQPFYWPNARYFGSLDTFRSHSLLLYRFSNSPTTASLLVPRGDLDESTWGEASVFQLELEGEPHNFFANGILVQSYVKGTGGK